MKYNHGNREIIAKPHNENNTPLYYQSPLSACNNFWLRSNVVFGEMMRQKYIVSNISEEYCGEDNEQ